MLEPRTYQLEAIEAVHDARLKGIMRQLISLPTGTGKTVIFALLAKEINARTLIIAHTQELLEQIIAKLKVVWPEADVGLVKAASDEVHAQVVVASIQTIARDVRLRRLKEQGFELMIIDESHHAAANSYIEVVKGLGFFCGDPSKLLVGVTATPKRGDGIGLGLIFEEIVFERSLSTMVRSGYLATLVGKQVFTKVELKGVGVRNGDFITSELSRTVNTEARNKLVVESHMQYASRRNKTLAFCVDVQHAKDLAQAFNAQGVAAEAVYGDMSLEERAQILRDFTSGKLKVLTNCQLLTEGFDEPGIDCLIMARPTRSTSLFTQMIGRGTRLYPTKRDCLVLDFCDNASKNDIRTFRNSLDGAVIALDGRERYEPDEEWVGPPAIEIGDSGQLPESRAYTDRVEDIKFFDSSDFAWINVSGIWRLNLGWKREVWVSPTDGGFAVIVKNEWGTAPLSTRPLSLGYALGVAEDWARKQTAKSAWVRKDAPWRSQEPTERQLQALRKMGVDFGPDISRGEASALLHTAFAQPRASRRTSAFTVR
jgi:superfamily II DNA or RNA helicase